MSTKIRNLFVLLALLSVTALVSFRVGKKAGLSAAGSTNSADALDLSLMWQVKQKLEDNYLDKSKIDDKNLVYGAISGMVASLGDPYTVFLSPKENQSTNADLAGTFGGVGIELGYKDKTLAVVAPLAKTPADKAGVKAGDLIVKIIDKENNVNKDTTGISLDEAVTLIRGKVGTEVTLTLYREGKTGTFDVTLKRDNIVVPSMEVEWVKKDGKSYAWIKLYKFSEQIYTDWPKAVDDINAQKSKLGSSYGGIILDLRNNPGGYLQASVLVASDFLKDGVVVTQQSAGGKDEVYKVDPSRGNLVNDKLVVLVNGGSASAAEILAGALKDHNRAQLVGDKTFGKGTVQQPEDFPDGSGLHITIAKWLLPDGSNIHGIGVNPDVAVSLDDNAKTDTQLDKAEEVLLK
jgi:carboxyl-terminal processing protease